MTNSKKGRGSGRSSIAPPVRLRHSVPPVGVVRSQSDSPEAVPERSDGIDDENRLEERGPSEQESEQIDGSIQKSIKDLELSFPPSSRPQVSLDDRPSEKAERWDEPGSRAVVETISLVPDHRLEDETDRTSRVEAAITATSNHAPARAVDDSTAADFFSRSSEDSASERGREQPTDTWESEYDPMSVSRGSKRTSYIIYTILGIVLLSLGGLYLYGSAHEQSDHSSKSSVRSEDAKPTPVLTPTASQAAQRIEPKQSEAPNTESDKTREATRNDSDGNPVEAESIAAADEIGASNTSTAIDDESSSPIAANPIQSEAAIDRECCSSIEEYQTALRLNPNDAEILGKLAYFYLNKGMNPEARRFAERTVNIDPKNSAGWIVLGAAFDAMNDHEAALVAYRACAEQAVGKYVVECRNLLR